MEKIAHNLQAPEPPLTARKRPWGTSKHNLALAPGKSLFHMTPLGA